MLRIIKERIHQKYRTLDYPHQQPTLSPRYMGRPSLIPVDCGDCRACYAACPTAALLPTEGVPGSTPTLDVGRCTFCGACRAACPKQAITFTGEHRMAAFRREDLLIVPGKPVPQPATPPVPGKFAIFRRSLKLRQVSAAGCNACEADCNVLGTLVFDLPRFGIDFVASPRHADGIVLTGPVSENMRLAAIDTYNATPEPRLVVAVGACAISGGLFRDAPQCNNGIADILPVDLFVPGCPPNPWTILDGLLMLRE
ncbi:MULTISPECIES: 4Fe-4S dicluster domain-containing protein [Desulfovibrio]|uniref:Ni,Fe-hydrogenase III small subunit n=1 Tax=Desulfovibrio desulfuricans TaxID=876 RepID=A0AA94HQR8_DESDE|nr:MULTISPECIES: 4Fe-4S dicluster domain-containing protein [Desulfovibrio]ATD81739.1 hydrogenase [Desulfovibrio sp. G11]SFW16518.1 Ni,Fe-hydrogenase III small subunit [Desulfovibrio desulfuricans]SPD34466.1 NADH:ubiquinone reductase (H+-translocating), 20 Kd subunit [Desulfovibrio sp. G11]